MAPGWRSFSAPWPAASSVARFIFERTVTSPHGNVTSKLTFVLYAEKSVSQTVFFKPLALEVLPPRSGIRLAKRVAFGIYFALSMLQQDESAVCPTSDTDDTDGRESDARVARP